MIWSDKQYSAYKQYSDDGIYESLFKKVGLAEVSHKSKTVSDLEDKLEAGTYVVSTEGSSEGSEGHIVVLVITGKKKNKKAEWKDYDQLKGQGFKDAKMDKNAVVACVYK